MQRDKILDEPCPWCGGQVESWYISDCDRPPISGVNCLGECKRSFSSVEEARTPVDPLDRQQAEQIRNWARLMRT